MQKPLLTFFAFTLALATSFSQPVKGSIQLGTSTTLWGGFNSLADFTPNNSGGVAFTQSKTKVDGKTFDGPKNTNIHLSPKFGLAPADGLMVGLDFDILHIRTKDDDDDEVDKTNGLSAGPFVRYYFPTKGKVVPYAEVSSIFGRLTDRYFDSDEDKLDIISLNARAGAAFFFSENISFDMMLGYSRTRATDPASDVDVKYILRGFGVGVGLSIFISEEQKE